MRIVRLLILCAALLLSSRSDRGAAYDYTGNAAAIEQSKAKLLSYVERDTTVASHGFMIEFFAEDGGLKPETARGFGLLYQICLMADSVATADEAWAWAQAADERIKAFNRTRNRTATTGEQTIEELEQMLTPFHEHCNAVRAEAAALRNTLLQYKVLSAYRRLIEECDDAQLQSLYYREFRAWLEMKDISCGLYYLYHSPVAYARWLAGSGYWVYCSSFLMRTKRMRIELLSAEKAIMDGTQVELTLEDDHRIVSLAEFGATINFFKTMTEESFRQMVRRPYYDGEEEPDEDIGKGNSEAIAKSGCCYESALFEWLDMREQIALRLPKHAHEPYREITRRLFKHLYTSLYDIKELN